MTTSWSPTSSGKPLKHGRGCASVREPHHFPLLVTATVKAMPQQYTSCESLWCLSSSESSCMEVTIRHESMYRSGSVCKSPFNLLYFAKAPPPPPRTLYDVDATLRGPGP